jgi:DNA-binding NarL/FixJ family response regulator
MSPSDSTGASSAASSDGPPLPAFRIIVVKWDMLSGDVLSRLAREAYPRAEVTLCRTGADALDALRRRPASLGLFGLTLPDIDGLDLLALVADEHLAQRRMIVTGRRDDYSRQALQFARVHGVFDTFVEDTSSLTTAIRRVGDGGEYFSAPLGSALPWPPPTRNPFPSHGLTLIEQQIFMIITEGASDDEIAQRLGMSLHTVGFHRSSILEKIGVGSSEELQAFTRRGMNPRR